MNNIILETGNPDNAKLVVEFEYLDTVNNFVDEDIFYAEEIEVKEEQVTGTATVEQYSPNCLYQSLEVQNEVIIEKDSSICESNSYEQAIKNLNSKLETPKISAKKTKKKKRKRSCSEDEWKLGEQTTFAKAGSIEVKPPLVPTPLKSFFGSSLGVSKCHICNKFTKRSCFEAHVQEHFQNGKKRKVEDVSFEEENDEINSLYDSSKQESLDEVFRCYLCSFVTNSQSTLEDHSESHAENKPVICTLCNFSCEDHKDIEAHMETHSDYSDSFVDDKSNDLYAIQKQNGDKAFKCNLCGFKSFQVSAYKTHIKKHVKVHTGENPIECKLCDYTCIKKASLKSHMKIHKESNIFDCPNCDFTTKNRGSLARHQLLHREDKPHKCSECSYQTAQKAALRAHMQRHKGEKPFKCPDCDYSSVEKTHLIRHSRQHTGEKPIFCFVCDYRCIQFGCLVTHVKRHNDCLMQCAFCHFNTLKSDALIVHLRAEHKRSWGKTPLQCPECSFKCFTKENLKKHTQNHVDLRKNAKQSEIVSDSEKLSQNIFSCKKCDFETSNKKYLKSHKKKEH